MVDREPARPIRAEEEEGGDEEEVECEADNLQPVLIMDELEHIYLSRYIVVGDADVLRAVSELEDTEINQPNRCGDVRNLLSESSGSAGVVFT